MRMKLTYLLVSPFKGIWRTILGAATSSPGVAFPKSRMERSFPGMDGNASFKLLIRGDEELLLAFLWLSRSCWTTAASFLLCTGAVAPIARAAAAAEEVGMLDMLVKDDVFACSTFGAAGGGGSGRLASTIVGFVVV